MVVKDYKDLEIWRLAKELATKVYKLTTTFPKEEKFSLTSQVRDSAISVSANIAEAFGRFIITKIKSSFFTILGALFLKLKVTCR